MAITVIPGSQAQDVSRPIINSNFAYAVSLSVQPGGTTVNLTVGASPFTYTAGATQEILYISGFFTSVKRHGVSLNAGSPLTVILPPGESMTLTYADPSNAPTVVRDK